METRPERPENRPEERPAAIQKKRSIWRTAGVLLGAAVLIPLVYLTVSMVLDSGVLDAAMPAEVSARKYPAYKSSVDKDGDGVDDQTDVLESAKAYLATEPQYKSEYYGTGYPTGEYGVCTDVVAFALKGAGYDLQKMVDRDIRRAPKKYGIAPGTRDKAIDFRRVGNLSVFFRRHAVRLTTDLGKPGKWQGGDIVVFKNHVAIVSDKRNRNGIPYILHLANPVQTKLHQYEQNALSKRAGSITGHYRMS